MGCPMEDIYEATGFAAVIFLLSSAQALGLRLQFWRAPDIAPALDAQIRKTEAARLDFLGTAALFAVMAFGMIEDGDVLYGRPLLWLIWLLLAAGFFLRHSTMPPKNVLSRRYVVGDRILVLTLIVALLGVAYLAIELLLERML